MRLRVLSIAAIAVLTAGASSAGAASATGAARAAGAPLAGGGLGSACGTGKSPGSYDHVVWIVFENKGLVALQASKSASAIEALMHGCAYSTNHHDITELSLPNYLTLTSGSTHGVKRDGTPSKYPISGPSIFSQLGNDWRVYVDAMPDPCHPSDAKNYAVRHNPAPYYTSLGSTCRTNDLPMGSSVDVSARFTMLLPDLEHSMHHTKTAKTTEQQIAAGDQWASAIVPKVLASPQYRAGRTALFIVWDEGGGTVPLIAIAPGVHPGTTTDTKSDHRTLLRLTEQLLGLPALDSSLPSADALRASLGL